MPVHRWRIQFSPQIFADTTCPCRALGPSTARVKGFRREAVNGCAAAPVDCSVVRGFKQPQRDGLLSSPE
eukprot:2073697-Pyramimonas_sp.AAC.1